MVGNTTSRSRICKVKMHPENSVLFQFCSLTHLQENCNTNSMGPASLRLSQPSARPSCSHHLWGQDSSHQCQTGR